MAERAAKALNDLMRCNLHGVGAVDRENLPQFALDYFDDENPAQSDTEDDFDDEVAPDGFGFSTLKLPKISQKKHCLYLNLRLS